MRWVPSGFGLRKMVQINSPGSCVAGMMTPLTSNLFISDSITLLSSRPNFF